MIEHHIQREIIHVLMRGQSVRFKDLKPRGMESNVFMYHLKQLIKNGYVKKVDAGYTLTAEGLTYVDNLSTSNQKLLAQPKVVTILGLRDNSGRWLMAKRKVQPHIGEYMLLSDQQRLGETTPEHLERLMNDLAIEADPLYRGQVEVMICDSENKEVLLTHIVGSVFGGVVKDGAVPLETEYFQYEWMNSLESTSMMFGTRELISALTDNKRLFFLTYKNVDFL